MSMGTVPDQADPGMAAVKFGLVWALKRALLGTVILVVALGSLAWLTHAAIDPSLEEGEGLLPSISRAIDNF
jgi:hypothetical protein